MSIIYIFDIDDTLYQINSDEFSYDKLKPSQQLIDNLNNIPSNIPKYILTNATMTHAIRVLNILQIRDQFKLIFSRDSINSMKPNPRCYIRAIKSIMENENINRYPDMNILFFDDLEDNLQGAKIFNWRTVLIKNDNSNDYSIKNKNYYNQTIIDYKFNNINAGLEYFNNLSSSVCNFNDNSLI